MTLEKLSRDDDYNMHKNVLVSLEEKKRMESDWLLPSFPI